MRHPAVFAAAVILPFAAAVPAADAETPGPSSLNLTVYTNGLALVDETRTLVPSGSEWLRLEGVGPRMVPDSLILEPEGGALVREISLDSDILSERTLLERSLGKTVKVIRENPATGVETVMEAQVLSVAEGLVLKIGDRIETSLPGRLVFDTVPGDLSATPTLSVRLAKPLAAETKARLAYLTDGLRWEAAYTAVLNPSLANMDLDGWAKITNEAGVDFGPATLSLVAGSVNRETAPMAGKILMRAEAMSAVADAGGGPVREGLSAFHLYRMPDVVTLADRETKRVALLSAKKAVTRRVLEFRSSAPIYGPLRGDGEPVHAQQRVELINDVASQLGLPLPAGVVRAYVPDKDGKLRFVGEDRIGNVAVGEKASLELGRAFDVTMTRRQTGFRQVGDRTNEASFALALKNGGPDAVTVKVTEDIAGDWEILTESRPHERDGLAAVWTVEIPAQGGLDLTYGVRVRR